jgi:hypothetical protein
MPSATEQFGQQTLDNEQVEEMGSNNHNSSSSSIVAWLWLRRCIIGGSDVVQ